MASGRIALAFIFSVSIEMLQLLLRLGTFQLSDIFYNTVGGVLVYSDEGKKASVKLDEIVIYWERG